MIEVLLLPYNPPLLPPDHNISESSSLSSMSLQVYRRCSHITTDTPETPEAPINSLLAPTSPPATNPSSTDQLPIAMRKGIYFTRNPHPIYNFLNYHRLSSP